MSSSPVCNSRPPSPFAESPFTPLPSLNALFPTVDSLSRAEQVQRELKQTARKLDEQIRELRKDLDERVGCGGEIEGVQALLTHLSLIRAKSARSASLVKEITNDISRLDNGKRNLGESTVALRRVGMCATAHAQLTEQAASRRSHPPISHLLASIADVTRQLRLSAAGEYERWLDRSGSAGPGSRRRARAEGDESGEGGEERVREAGDCIDAIGQDAIRPLLNSYTTHFLAPYRRIFRPSDEAGQLPNVSRRFAWFRRALKEHEALAGGGGVTEGAAKGAEGWKGVWKESWGVERELVGAFSRVTSDDLHHSLNRAKTAGELTVHVLIEALEATREFEREAERRWKVDFRTLLDTPSHPGPRTGSDGPNGAGLPNTISAAFEGFMDFYVDAQERTLSDMHSSLLRPPPTLTSLTSLPAAPSSTSAEEPPASLTVLPSSASLFYFYRQTLDRCAQLDRKALLGLSGVFGKWLGKYAGEVLGATLGRTDRRSLDGRPSDKEIQGACLVLNTADYCRVTTKQLEERLKEKIHPDLVDEISFADQQDMFVSVISLSLTTLLTTLEHSLESSLSSMLRSPWPTNAPTCASSYARDLVRALEDTADAVREGLEQRRHYKTFCDKAVGVVLSRYTSNVVKSRPISAAGAEQIILDTSHLLPSLLSLPRFGFSLTDDPATSLGSHTSTYVRTTTASIGKLESIARLVLLPADDPQKFGEGYTEIVGDRSFGNVQKVLDLKGVPRAQQNAILDTFVNSSSAQGGVFAPLLGGVASVRRSSDDNNYGGAGSSSTMGMGMGMGNEGAARFSDFRRLVTSAIRRGEGGQ
uniref:Vps53 N-terminal domain-containing protein n=1 Tax=Bartheletia paradoxa TaxID=669517 RepID=A0A2D0XI52_9BASI|nr:hypothetical protein SPAR02395 [Bartheletia paradoxa]